MLVALSGLRYFSLPVPVVPGVSREAFLIPACEYASVLLSLLVPVMASLAEGLEVVGVVESLRVAPVRLYVVHHCGPDDLSHLLAVPAERMG